MNYNEMTDAELDELSANMFGYKYIKANFTGYIFKDGNYDIEWIPTYEDSNQAERYLFPKLRGKGQVIEMCYWMKQIKVYTIHKPNEFKPSYQWSDETLNRTKVITCLEAWEKINE